MLDLTQDDCEEGRIEIEGHNSLDLPNNVFPSACSSSSSSSSSSATAIETSYSSYEKEKRRLTDQLIAEQAELNAFAQQEPIPLTVSGFKNNLFYAMGKDLRGDQGSYFSQLVVIYQTFFNNCLIYFCLNGLCLRTNIF